MIMVVRKQLLSSINTTPLYNWSTVVPQLFLLHQTSSFVWSIEGILEIALSGQVQTDNTQDVSYPRFDTDHTGSLLLLFTETLLKLNYVVDNSIKGSMLPIALNWLPREMVEMDELARSTACCVN